MPRAQRRCGCAGHANETAGLGDIGRLLLQSGAPLTTVQIEALGKDNAVRHQKSREVVGRFNFVFDLNQAAFRFTSALRNASACSSSAVTVSLAGQFPRLL